MYNPGTYIGPSCCNLYHLMYHCNNKIQVCNDVCKCNNFEYILNANIKDYSVILYIFVGDINIFHLVAILFICVYCIQRFPLSGSSVSYLL